MRPSVDMAHYKAIVELQPLTLAESPRSLTISSASDRVEIGRASKRQNKNLQPTRHNALFDSRVMSRTHAIIHASPEKKLIYIRDPGSMHGTLLNGKDITCGEDIVLKDGDELTFGVEVVRGSETFPPLRVRCGCRWETEYLPMWTGSLYAERNDEKPRKQTSRNTFTVPDDDDDDDDDDDEEDDNNEYESDSPACHPAAVDLTSDQTSESNASDAGSESEDSRSVVGVSSPMTSPFKTDELNGHSEPWPEVLEELPTTQAKLSTDDNANSEQPLATPRMTPPSVNGEPQHNDDENQYYDEYLAHSSDEDSNLEPGDSDMDGEEANKGQEEGDYGEEKTNGPISAPKSPQAFDFGPNIPALKPTTKMPEAGDAPEHGISTEDRDAARKTTQATERQLSVERPSTNFSQQQERVVPGNLGSIPLTPLYSSFSRYDAQPAFQSNGKLSEPIPPYLDNNNTLPPILQPHQAPPPLRYPLGRLPLQSPFSLYTDGPFATSPSMTGATAPCTESNNCVKPDCGPFLDPFSPMMPRTSCDTSKNSDTAPATGLNESRLSDFDLNPSSPKKRKAAEIESEDEYELYDPDLTCVSRSDSLGFNADVELPDAQPQTSTAALKGEDSQLTTVSASEATEEVKKDERPSKKVKTSHKGSLKSHAATAIVAAMVGAVGTIAALASLPPDFFA
ncbi:hypothetical protein BDV18DRAFT_123954 [Aspergillus unguis]